MQSMLREAAARLASMALGKRAKFYAVRHGRVRGVYKTWDECRAQVDHFPGCVFKSFPTESEAHAFVAGSTKRSAPDEEPCAKIQRTTERETSVQDAPAIASDASVAAPPDTLVVYTDGSSRGNGRNGAMAGYGVYWDDPRYHHLNVSKQLEGDVQTNNRAELQAIISAVELAPDPDAPLQIYTDSRYAINAVTAWMPMWRKNGWVTSTGNPVLNQDLIIKLDRVFAHRKTRPELVHVRGHSGICLLYTSPSPRDS